MRCLCHTRQQRGTDGAQAIGNANQRDPEQYIGEESCSEEGDRERVTFDEARHGVSIHAACKPGTKVRYRKEH